MNVPGFRNPVLTGFNPDPSIVRVGPDYYIATSTFEWYPGVQIHHSRDLAHWTLITRPLRRASQLDMRGEPDSCGIWAPCLTHADGLFWLVYTDVKRYGRASGAPGGTPRDVHNYLVTGESIDGEWSEPIFLNSSGFDPSLFHDEDGRKYLVNMLWDHRPGVNRFGGIVLQEYSVAERCLVGARVNIFSGTELGFTEAPHLYRRNGWYYLITAEGGTGWGHAVTMARAREITGPYTLHPDGQILTARDRPDASLQRAGHADLVETPDGETWMAYLCGRPIPNRGRCTLGRETALQPMVWGEDNWLRTRAGDALPELIVGSVAAELNPYQSARCEFDGAELPHEFQWLRSPHHERLFSLSDRAGFLRLHGRESIGSLFEQSLVARRLQSHCASVSTALEFEPEHFQHMAGLVCYYNSSKFHYCFVSRDDGGRYLRVMSVSPDAVAGDTFTRRVALPDASRIELRVEIDFERLRFAYRTGGSDTAWQWLPEVLDASILSDEAALPGTPNFTGTFVGMACQDLAGTALHADFDWFEYVEREFVAA